MAFTNMLFPDAKWPKTAMDIFFWSNCVHVLIKCAENVVNKPGYSALIANSCDAAALKENVHYDYQSN